MRAPRAAEIVALATAPLQKGVTVDLTGLEVREALDLSGATIGNVDFSRSRFLGPLIARGACFAGLAWFRQVEICAGIDVSRAVFCNDLRMRGAHVQGAATFSRAELRGVFDLDHVRFDDRLDLDGLIVMGSMSMSGSAFGAPVTMQDSDFLGGLWCENSSFASRADFLGVEVHGRTWLKHTTIGGAAIADGLGPASEIQSFGYRWI